MSSSTTVSIPPLRVPPALDDGKGDASSGSTVRELAGGFIAGAVAMGAGYWLLSGGDLLPETSVELSGAGLALALIGLVVLLPVVLAVHEGGHLLGGRLARFRFHLFIVGPLMIARTAEGVRVRLNTNLSLYGGLAASVPTTFHNLNRRMAVMVAGGPAASLLSGAVAIAIYLVAGLHTIVPEGAIPVAWLGSQGVLVFGGASLGIGLITLMPATTSGFFTDGARLWRLLHHHPTAKRDTAVTIVGLLGLTQRPRDWDADLVATACSGEDGSLFDTEARRLAYLQALDTGCIRAGRDWLQEALDRVAHYPPSMQSLLPAEAAFVEGAFRRDGVAAARWLDRVTDRTFLDDSTWLRAQAAVAYANNHPVHDLLDNARSALAASTAPGIAAAERDWVDQLAHSSSCGDRPPLSTQPS
jgi:hypothetical protein